MNQGILKQALASLNEASRALGLDSGEVQLEAQQLSAAVAESNVGAYLAWCAEFDLPADAESFTMAATKGRRYRSAPTRLASYAANIRNAAGKNYLDALVDVATAAAMLGDPNPSSLGAAQAAAAAQLQIPPVLGANLPNPNNVATSDTQFVANAPGILNEVLARLSQTQTALLDLNTTAMTPGAIPGINPSFLSPLEPNPAPSESQQQASEENQAQAQTQTQSQAKLAKELPEKSVDEWLEELDALVGLDTVKSEIRRQSAILRIDSLRTEAGLKSPTITRHLIFTGNPGTGKTTVARMVAGIYKALGLLSKGQLVEVDRSELVAGYLGQTAMKTAEVIEQAKGGVLFIDEAYGLSGDQYGVEAINTLVKGMEDNRDDLVIIVAGYPLPMAVFISENPGLSSRFRTEINFPNYTDTELHAIFNSMVTGGDFDLGEGVTEELQTQLDNQIRDETFGNARYVRNVFEAAIGKHAWRLRDIENPTLDELRTILPQDLRPDPQPVVDWDGVPTPDSDESPQSESSP
ncbi:MAG: AAA family ATPase [Propionibacteriaceae bacterium]|nr:AAA family ATPase [Propionibacteriaceae bacterium]